MNKEGNNMIDLHVHSNISDGTLTPSQVIDLAVELKLKAIALTDHDTIEGIPEAFERAKFYQSQGIDFTLIPGVELSVGYKKRDIHILGLNINYKNEAFVSLLNQMVLEREERNRKMVENFQNAGFDITLEALQAEAKNAVITRAHFAKELVRKKYVSSHKEAFNKFLGEDGSYYVNRKYITPEQAIEAILQADGIPCLAHPILYHLPPTELDQLVARLTQHGLQGIEAIYSTYSHQEESVVKRLASKYNLLLTGGSDFHGEVKPDISLGTGMGNLEVPDSLLDHILK